MTVCPHGHSPFLMTDRTPNHMNTVRRVSYVFLCIVPFLCFVVVGVRALRVPGVYQAVGVAYFAAIAIPAWTLRGRARGARAEDRRVRGVAGWRLVSRFAPQ